MFRPYSVVWTAATVGRQVGLILMKGIVKLPESDKPRAPELPRKLIQVPFTPRELPIGCQRPLVVMVGPRASIPTPPMVKVLPIVKPVLKVPAPVLLTENSLVAPLTS